MSYIDGFIIAAPAADKAKVIEHAERIDQFFLGYGATRVVEGWADDVPDGKVTDFRKAVQARDGEEVLFSWIAWPDKATRDAAQEKMRTDERMMAEPMPFDGSRMIFGGFAPVVELTFKDGKLGYVDGFVGPVLPGRNDDYRKQSEDSAAMFEKCGALFDIESLGDDVKDGRITDFNRASKAMPGETIAFSFVGWPDKATRDAGWQRMMAEMTGPADLPFDGKRMFYGGFEVVVDIRK